MKISHRYFSRFRNSPVSVKEGNDRTNRTFAKRKKGWGSPTAAAAVVRIPGRVVLDMLPMMRKLYRNGPSGYKLGTIAKEILQGEGNLKDNVDYWDIDRLQRNGPGITDGRGKLAKYCIQDAWLALQLMNLCWPVFGETRSLLDVYCLMVADRGGGSPCYFYQ